MPATTAPRIALVVEDDDDIRGLLVHTLELEGFSVSESRSGTAAVELARTVCPELVTLDLNLPGLDGMEVCRELRTFSQAYIIMLTARAAEIDKLAGLESGADDFLTKPFSTRELRARVAALFRRPRTAGPEPTELDRAVEVQRGLLPGGPPDVAGYDVAGSFRPSRLVGGDFYDWHTEEGMLHLTLADAMGKGIGAALIAATVRATLRSSAGIAHPSDAFAHVARTLSSGLEASGSFATVFTARLDPATSEFDYVDAGHGFAAVVGPGGAYRRLEAGGPPLGLWAEGGWVASRAALSPGEALVVVSDGVLDAVGDLEPAFAAVAAAVDAAGSAQEAADAVAALADADGGADDATAVVVRRSRAEAAPAVEGQCTVS